MTTFNERLARARVRKEEDRQRAERLRTAASEFTREIGRAVVHERLRITNTSNPGNHTGRLAIQISRFDGDVAGTTIAEVSAEGRIVYDASQRPNIRVNVEYRILAGNWRNWSEDEFQADLAEQIIDWENSPEGITYLGARAGVATAVDDRDGHEEEEETTSRSSRERGFEV